MAGGRARGKLVPVEPLVGGHRARQHRRDNREPAPLRPPACARLVEGRHDRQDEDAQRFFAVEGQAECQPGRDRSHAGVELPAPARNRDRQDHGGRAERIIDGAGAEEPVRRAEDSPGCPQQGGPRSQAQAAEERRVGDRQDRAGDGAREREEELPAGLAHRPGGIGGQDREHARGRLGEPVIAVPSAVAPREDGEPDLRIGDIDVAMLDQAASDFITDIAVGDVVLARTGQGHHREDRQEETRKRHHPS
ncbi:MAG: hypothetical protein ACLQIB_27945 [Isosphaeraceae bacterium]